MNNKLAIVIPVYNESECLSQVVQEWHMLTRRIPDSKLIVFNDGSTDDSLKILEKCKEVCENLIIVDKENTGHGQTCIEAYRYAVSNDYEYVFQTDSDGQTNPSEFIKVWNEKNENENFIFGFRPWRGDGIVRYIVSRILRLVVLAIVRVNVRDSNVPFRLMKCKDLEPVIEGFPKGFYLANVFLSVLVAKSEHKIKWVPITFRPRLGGAPSVGSFGFLKKGYECIEQLIAYRRM